MRQILLLSALLFGLNSTCQNGDIDLLKKINGSYTENGGKFMKIVTNSVNPISLGLPVGLFIAGKVRKDHRMVVDSYELLSSTLLNGIITTSLKFGIERERPFITYPNDVIKYTKAGSHSFPSGHTSMAFATAMTMSLLYPKWYIIVPSFVWASSMGYSRMYLGVHYPTDILAGALIGCASSIGTHYLFKYLRKRYVKNPAVTFSFL